MSGKTFRASDFAKLHEIIVVCLLFHLSSSDINIYTCRICRLPLQSLVCCGPGEDGDLEVLKFLYRCFFSHYRPRIQNRGSGGGSLGLKWRPTSRDPNSGIIKGGGRAGCSLPPPPRLPWNSESLQVFSRRSVLGRSVVSIWLTDRGLVRFESQF